jgi:hypothetical protein
MADLIEGHEKYSDEGQEHARQIVFGWDLPI